MIYCFSGTGNSSYVAKRISKITGDTVISVNDKIKNNEHFSPNKGERLVFVTPTYGWRIPRIVEKWIEYFKGNGNKAYFVMTCGGEIANSAKYLKKLCLKCGFEFMGVSEIVMPENYIAMFSAPDREESIKIIKKSEPDIDKTAQIIKNDSHFSDKKTTTYDKILSGIVNDVYYPVFLHAKKFYAKDSCIGCGKCEKLCPLNNIKMKNGRPVWDDNCTHCMACICHCPASAIEYGNKSKNQPRYTCPY